MTRMIKVLGVAMVAALALTAVMASAASAQFTSSNSESTTIHGEQEGSHKFTAGEGFGAITCTTATFEGKQTGGSVEDITINPTYDDCKDTFGRTVHVDDEGLTYTFTPNGTVHVSETMTLTVTSSGSVVCTVSIHTQVLTGAVVYDNLGGTSGVRVTTNATGVDSTTSGGFFNCGISNGAHTAGTYTGNTVMTGKATKGGAAVEIKVD